MNILRTAGGVVAVVLLAVTISAYSMHTAQSSDHQDSPTVLNNKLEDITDVFAFPAPDNPNNVVFIMDVDPLIPSGMYQNEALDPNVLYQFKIANVPGDPKEHLVIQLKANGTGPSQSITLYGPASPNEIGTTNTLVAQNGTFQFNQNATLSNGVRAFVGPRREPFFFDLAQFFKIIPDRNYKNQPNPPAPTATSFNFPSASTVVKDATGATYGTAGALGCVIGQPNDLLKNFDILSIVVSVPKSMIAPSGGSPGKIGLWTTASTQSGS